MKSKKPTTYYVGILVGINMTECNFACSDLAEAVQVAKKENKNVYQKANGFFYLKKVFYKPISQHI